MLKLYNNLQIFNSILFIITVYDVLTGVIVSALSGHHGCVRDVSWHPFHQEIVSTSVSKFKG